MAITFEDVRDDPALFLHDFLPDAAVFQPMTEADLRKSIFVDGRIRHGNRPNFRVPLGTLIDQYAAHPAPPRRIGWIFHIAHCGSTLLARALDHPGRSFVLREPLAPRRLGVLMGADREAGSSDAGFAKKLSAATAILGKRWDTDKPLVIKANVPVNFIAHEIMAADPAGPAVLLYFPLAKYLAAVLRTDSHADWVGKIYDELRIAGSPLVVGNEPTTLPEKAGALWFTQMKAFESLLADYPGTSSLDASYFFAHSSETIRAAAHQFDIDLSEQEIEEMVSGELFATYSKNPALDYEVEVRAAREREAIDRLSAEIGEARAWVGKAAERHGLPETLARPLAGESPKLLG